MGALKSGERVECVKWEENVTLSMEFIFLQCFLAFC